MKRLAMVLLVVAAALPARADLAVNQTAKDEWGAPEIALRVHNEEIGTHEIETVLYASGRLLYRDVEGDEQPADYLVVTLTPAEKRALVEGLPLSRVGALHPPKSHGADGATHCIDVWTAGTHKSDCVWGNVEYDSFNDPPPPEMSAIWRHLAHFTSPRAQRWVPDQVTVSVIPQNCGRRAAIPMHLVWPAGWPTHGEPIKTFDGNGFKFTVGGDQVPALRRLEKAQRMGACIQLVDGRNMRTAFRYSLPHEQPWWRTE